MMDDGVGSGSGSLPYPCPKSPPRYPDMSGKRKELAAVLMLEREIGLLQEELKSCEGLQLASVSCKEVDDFMLANQDPLIPINQKIRKSCRFWKWLCGKSCLSLSWICCCFSGCPCRSGSRKCCVGCGCPSRKKCCHQTCCICPCRFSCSCCCCCFRKTSCQKCCKVPTPSCPKCTCSCFGFKKLCHCFKCRKNCCNPCYLFC